ncbi:helix-hairpin-helix domain-containing protein [Pseudomonas chlororaphis subsp. aurantiaca]|uniref:ComEA family DNA-binding protein n=1 Tax=Pseudomonas chlororaphis TaxID=587753 RepID=UPI0027DE3592|nr:helix-hairpin-helix domain-containing protein [Pseudomonas chlororaphis]WMI98295.1 helix-hairpin-helix domain-containing protein [Pseudomonas chlororaphis subsp. aurantiaca]
MYSGFFYSLVFTLFAALSTGAVAAPTVEPTPVVQEVSQAQSGKVDLNGADVATLQRELAGVGKVKAQAIVTYRDINGPFTSVDELLEVKGIGKAILDNNREKLEIK